MAPWQQPMISFSWPSINRVEVGLLSIDDVDLVSYLKLNNDVLDSANSNNGTVTGTTTFTTGQLGGSTGAFDFNGSSYITLANESNFDFEHSSPFSVVFWFKTSTASSDMGLVTKDNDIDTATAGWSIRQSTANTLLIRFQDSAANNFDLNSDGNTYNDGSFHQAVFTYSGNSNRSGMKLYVDGSLVNTGTALAISNSILNNIGVVHGAWGDGGEDFTGQMDDVQVWSKELTSDNVTYLYNSGSGRELT